MNYEATPPCMGGWCALRDSCARYHQAGPQTPSERLCVPGQANAYRPLPLIVWSTTRHAA